MIIRNICINPKAEFLIYGVTKMDCLIESNWKKQLASLLTMFFLFHTVNFATRVQNNSSTAIDNIFVDNNRIHLSSVSPIVNGLLKHNAQILKIKNLYVWNNKQISFKAEIQINRNETIMNSQTLLKKETWECVYIDKDPNHMLNSCLCAFLNIFQASFSVKWKVWKARMIGLYKE
jgi:hypothetical protein